MHQKLPPILFLTLLCLFLFVPVPVCHAHTTGDQPIYRVRDGKTITFDEMMKELQGTDVVLVGESHDVPEHHQLQLAVIDAYRKAGADVAVGMEMFTSDSQRHLDRWVDGTMNKSGFIRIYYRNWQLPWPLYSDILLYSRKYKIPLVGLNVDPKITRKVARKGFSSLSKQELAKVPQGVSCVVDPTYMAFIRDVYSSHMSHKKGDKSFRHFCEAQRLWNTAMASGIAGYLKKNSGKTMVVLTGAGHALKSGIPAELANISKLSYKVILPEFPELNPDTVETDQADYVMLE